MHSTVRRIFFRIISLHQNSLSAGMNIYPHSKTLCFLPVFRIRINLMPIRIQQFLGIRSRMWIRIQIKKYRYRLNFFYLDLIFQLEKLCLFLLLTSKLFFKMPNFTMLDPDPYFWSNPDSGGQLHGDLDPKHWLYHLKSYRQ